LKNKAHLRKILRRQRREHVAAQSEAVRALLFNRPPVPLVETISPDATIGLYHATSDEAPTRGYAQFFLEAGHDIALPFFAGAKAQMEFRTFSDPFGESDLERGPFGVLQPTDDLYEIVPDVVFVPLIGFTPAGDRLGQGGGHYDRWLAGHPQTRAIGLAWDSQCVDELPMEAHDQRLHMIITPTRIYGLD
jgi:5-formyltetrahydrofolate cyclo-ligase